MSKSRQELLAAALGVGLAEYQAILKHFPDSIDYRIRDRVRELCKEKGYFIGYKWEFCTKPIYVKEFERNDLWIGTLNNPNKFRQQSEISDAKLYEEALLWLAGKGEKGK